LRLNTIIGAVASDAALTPAPKYRTNAGAAIAT